MSGIKSEHCSKGHPLSGKNLYQRKNGQRECRECSIARVKFQRASKKQSPLPVSGIAIMKRSAPPILNTIAFEMRHEIRLQIWKTLQARITHEHLIPVFGQNIAATASQVVDEVCKMILAPLENNKEAK